MGKNLLKELGFSCLVSLVKCVMVKKIDILEHKLVPAVRVLNDEEVTLLLQRYGIKKVNLPKILQKDKVCEHLSLEQGKVIEISRESPTVEMSYYYRVVV